MEVPEKPSDGRHQNLGRKFSKQRMSNSGLQSLREWLTAFVGATGACAVILLGFLGALAGGMGLIELSWESFGPRITIDAILFFLTVIAIAICFAWRVEARRRDRFIANARAEYEAKVKGWRDQGLTTTSCHTVTRGFEVLVANYGDTVFLELVGGPVLFLGRQRVESCVGQAGRIDCSEILVERGPDGTAIEVNCNQWPFGRFHQSG